LANREVHLSKQVNTKTGRRYCTAALSANGRVKQDIVLVDGKEEHHAEGCYYIRWSEGGKRHRKSVGKNATEAGAARLRKEAELNARAHGVALAPSPTNGHRSLLTAVADFLDETKLTHKPRSQNAYKNALEYFMESCPKAHIEEIDRKDLLKFSAFLRDQKKQSPRSVYNKFEIVMSFLKAQGVRGLVDKYDWPKYVEEAVEIYEQSDLDTLFSACDAEEQLWFEFFLMTGMREQEVMHFCWSDVIFAASVVRVTHKPDLNWTPKAYKEREIPVPDKLTAALKAHRSKSDRSCKLVFPTAGGLPKLDFLDCLKSCARRAGLDPDDFWLHKFRSTFATWSLWAGVDFRTVQECLGHSDLESTMRYLKPSRSQQVREKVNAIFG